MRLKSKPVWVLVCRFRSNVSLKPLPQNVHKYLLISEWHLECRLSSLCKANFCNNNSTEVTQIKVYPKKKLYSFRGQKLLSAKRQFQFCCCRWSVSKKKKKTGMLIYNFKCCSFFMTNIKFERFCFFCYVFLKKFCCLNTNWNQNFLFLIYIDNSLKCKKKKNLQKKEHWLE